MPRDTQRQRVYDSETVLHGKRVSAAARKHLMGEDVAVSGHSVIDTSKPKAEVNGQMVSRIKPLKVAKIADVQQYVTAVVTAAWFQRRWGTRNMTVEAGRGSHAPMWSNSLTVSTYHRQSEEVILHEMAHALTPPGRAAHGPEFTGILLTLVKHVMGAEHATALRTSLREHRARYSMACVPAPTREVKPVRQQAVAAKRADRERQARDERTAIALTTSTQGTNKTAASLRVQIAAGVFGSPGSVSRKAALSTARVLEKHQP